MRSVDKIQVIVNPASSDNAGTRLWGALTPHFEALFSTRNYVVSVPQSKEQSIEIAATTDADLIISVSGDGAIHNIAQGIMKHPRDKRPALAVVPVGSGNDFARSLGIPADPRKALEAIHEGRRVSIDVGSCNDIVYMETMSFGIDAAIAIKTVEARKINKQRGIMLYAGVAISAILHELKKHHFVITLEDGRVIDDEFLICAIQNGPTYGGGFRVAPKALLDDGLLNISIGSTNSKLYALFALALLSQGKHEGLKIFNTMTARRLTIDLDEDIPVQCDGEEILGRHFDIKVIPQAIDVIVSDKAAISNTAFQTSERLDDELAEGKHTRGSE
jgi:YegS/Rv2252/BmrU family lipid kinase